MILQQVLFVLVVLAAVGIIGLVLLQQSKGDTGSAFGGGGSQSLFGSRGSANFLSRSTSVLVTVFFVGSLALAFVYAKNSEISRSVTEESVLESTQDSEDTSVPAVPDAPAGAGGTSTGGESSESVPVVPGAQPEGTQEQSN